VEVHAVTSPREDAGFSVEEVLNSITQAVVVTDLDGVVTFWNHGAEVLYGWSASEALGRHINTLTVPAVAEHVANQIMESLIAGRPWTGGFTVRRKDGTMFPALVSNSGLYRQGKLVGIVGISTNLGRALHPLLERSTDAALVLRSDGVVTYASPAVAQLFGWEDSIVGTSLVPLLHPDERPALADFLASVVEHPGAHPPLELRVLTEEGWVWAEAALTNLLEDPDVRGVVCNLRRSLRREAHETAETRVAQLNTALQSRIVIEQAKGILAGRHGIAPDDGFERLRHHSRNNHVALREVARQVVAGELDLPTG
jgi:PAS domain S-box-containing protein